MLPVWLKIHSPTEGQLIFGVFDVGPVNPNIELTAIELIDARLDLGRLLDPHIIVLLESRRAGLVATSLPEQSPYCSWRFPLRQCIGAVYRSLPASTQRCHQRIGILRLRVRYADPLFAVPAKTSSHPHFSVRRTCNLFMRPWVEYGMLPGITVNVHQQTNVHQQLNVPHQCCF